MADVAIRKSGESAVPNDYLIPGAQEIVLRSVSAVMDGSGAAVAWFPCLEIVDPSGNVLVSAVPTTSVAAGASADVSWFPGVTQAASGLSSTVIPWPAAVQASSVLDDTSWSDTVDGTGTFEGLAIDGNHTSVFFAGGYQGDSFPSVVVLNYAFAGTQQGIYFGDGANDAVEGSNFAGVLVDKDNTAHANFLALWSDAAPFLISSLAGNNPSLVQATVKTLGIQAAQGVGFFSHYSGTGVPTIGGEVGDKYWRGDGAGGTYLYTCTVAGAPGFATWVAIL